MSSDNKITFYDIASKPPSRTFAPNPWKTRFALNYKGLPYQTQWVDMPDITALRENLGVPANRTLPNGKPFHTLPVINDPSTGKLLGDTFEIALYLDSAYPEAPKLFRSHATGLTAAFNAHVDGLFTKYAILNDQMPFDPRCLDKVMAMFTKRAESMSVDLQLNSDQREKMFLSFEADLGELAKAYRHTGGTTDYFWRTGGTQQEQSQRPPADREQAGPFLDGNEPAYADFIVGAWLKAIEASMKPEDWQRLRSWQDGLWGRVVDALDKWSEIK
jgi:glutathione S-transferase